MLDLYKNIKDRRNELGITQEELAEKTGYSGKSMIAKIEKGSVDLSQSKIMLFAEALQTTPSYLMGWTDDPDPNYIPNSKDHLDKALMEFMGKLISNQEDLKDYDRFTVELPIALTKLEKEIIAAFRQADLVDQNSVLRILGLEKKEASSESKIS